ncbi:outer membrane lipoprotein LolB [Kushneria phosphatilytica]|uniref:Outer-membrane lipoprotein LolB n=2 Tax=Kushneria phosphatilytica TaxID=657387 RepID=A0A1S1NT14_9GAMM|nr:lipoprotein insertase outer membrane protein LolB [Kushneria phosphatilytica]OHV12389.1 outer membrane lipoprotein LolB [Kushneria phosphatilytica]QEL12826.1 lipoprotein localization protein LolB [Kushneria phosphatilytica]
MQVTLSRPTNRHLAHLWVTFLFVVLLAGCAGQPPQPDMARKPGDWKSQHERLTTLSRWDIAGKVAIRTPEDSESANLDWQRTPDHYRIMVSGPFGAGRNTLEGNSRSVTLTNGDGTFRAATPEALMEDRMGWSLPVSALDYWIRGLPAPGTPHRVNRDDTGFPEVMHQNGWTIQYRDWTRADGLWLPRRLIMDYGELHSVLVLNQWQPSPSAK